MDRNIFLEYIPKKEENIHEIISFQPLCISPHHRALPTGDQKQSVKLGRLGAS
jgi:hypothetical protein